MEDWKEKLRTLLDALGTQHVETFMKSAKALDYTRYGFAYRKATEDKIAEQRKQAQLEILDKVLGEVSIIHDKGYVRTCDIEKLREELK